ncbi:MAG: histidine phosphatase family protein [bacterium]
MIRHGQASFGASNYDELSKLGELQMRVLGEYWKRWRAPFHAVYTGSLQRQKDSSRCLLEAYTNGGEEVPEPVELPELDEYDTQSLLTDALPGAIMEREELASLVRELNITSAEDLVNDRKAFQRLFSAVMDLWVRGELESDDAESWNGFVDRVKQGIEKITSEEQNGRNVAVITSGGPISVAVQQAMSCPDKVALELGWVIWNSSLTEFRYSGDKFSLAVFNSTPHLVEDELYSYR